MSNPDADPHDPSTDSGERDDVAERYELEADEAAPVPQPDADQGPDSHVGGGQDLSAPREETAAERARRQVMEAERVAQATGELPEDFEPVNATGFSSTDKEVSHLCGSGRDESAGGRSSSGGAADGAGDERGDEGG